MLPNQIAPVLLGWYDREHRVLPWRVPPGSKARPDPYRVWLSEVMLQQTTVAAVIPYFETFVSRWPTVTDLAAARDDSVMAAWAGLGYYARARNMLATARAVGGAFPDTEEGLRALPGVGPYTAAAIAAIAFGRRAVVVDGNVERVVARLFAVEEPLPAAKPRLRALADNITPDARAGDFAQAMMDLGATVCRPRTPACGQCPLTAACAAFAGGRTAELPARKAKEARPVRHGVAYWIESNGRVLLVRRPAKGLLGGMLALPSSEFVSKAPSSNENEGPDGGLQREVTIAHVRHVFTHFELRLDVFAREALDGPTTPGEWVAISDLGHAGLPSVYRKAVDQVLNARGGERIVS